MKLKLALLSGMLMLLAACSDPGEPAENPSDGVGTESTSGADGDLATVQDYELTMEGIDRYYEVMKNVALAMSEMTTEEREQHELTLDADDAGGLDDMAARFNQDPILREALADAGMTADEYTLLTMSLIQSGMAAAVIEMQPNADPDSLARAMQANPENIAFIRENRDALDAKQQAMEAELERLGVAEE